MIYAPVIIPTLNRYEHFKQCLESLENCTGADCTDVYVALDYPPSEKYVDGWKKVDSYLHEKEQDNKFKSLIVYRRRENYFFSGKGNATAAINDLPAGVDRYIFSEDDNVFSPNFLEFINKGLEKFNNDPSVLAICGYSHPYKIKYKDNNYFMQSVDFSAWGYGIWRKRRKACYIASDKSYLRDKLKKWGNIRTLKEHGLNRLLYTIGCAFSKGEISNNDNTLSIYMALENMNVVMPVFTKVRNIGWDGSGINCIKEGNVANSHTKRIIDDDKHFEYLGDGMYEYENNRKIFVDSSYARCSYMQFFIGLTTGFIRYIFRKR